jgi:hypothetical protein
MTQGIELIKEWYCPSCHIEHRSIGSLSARHNCSAHNGLDLPLVLMGRNATHRINEREDYLKGDLSDARDDNGRVIMSAYTEFDDGSHETTVFMPCAVIEVEIQELKG